MLESTPRVYSEGYAVEMIKALRLKRLSDIEPFAGYIPPNMRGVAKNSENICIGAIYEGYACGAALAENTRGRWYVRSVYIDPKARLCGLGTYLLRGLMGTVKELHATEIILMYTPSMLNDRNYSSMFQRVGFSAPEPYATTFAVPLGTLVIEGIRATAVTIVPIYKARANVRQNYYKRFERMEFPEFADDRGFIYPPEPECCLLAIDGDEIAGAITVFRDEGRKELFVRGLFVHETKRGKGIAMALITKSFENAVSIYDTDYIVRTSAITLASYGLCDRLFKHDRRLKETVFYMTCSL